MFKRLIIPTLILALAVPLMAQRPGRLLRPKIQQRQGVRGLGLSTEQRNTLRSMMEANKAQRQAIMQDVRQKAQILRQLQAQANPNPTELGNALLALRDARGRARQLRQQTMDSFKNSLSAEQRKRIEDLQSRRKNRRGGV